MKVQVIACDFCGKTQHQIDHLVTAEHVAICSECISLAAKVIAEATARGNSAPQLQQVQP